MTTETKIPEFLEAFLNQFHEYLTSNNPEDFVSCVETLQFIARRDLRSMFSALEVFDRHTKVGRFGAVLCAIIHWHECEKRYERTHDHEPSPAGE